MELAKFIILHVSFSSDFPGVKIICYALSVIATVPGVLADVVSRTTSWAWPGCARGAAVPATRVSTRGRLPSDTWRSCTAGCAEIWICSASRAITGWACSPGYFACFAFPLIVAPHAAIVFFRFASIAASYPRRSPLNRERLPTLTRPCISAVFRCGTFRKAKVDFRIAKRMMTKGDGVRLITAVLLAGQMMTPDKFLVAEPCSRQ